MRSYPWWAQNRSIQPTKKALHKEYADSRTTYHRLNDFVTGFTRSQAHKQNHLWPRLASMLDGEVCYSLLAIDLVQNEYLCPLQVTTIHFAELPLELISVQSSADKPFSGPVNHPCPADSLSIDEQEPDAQDRSLLVISVSRTSIEVMPCFGRVSCLPTSVQ